MFRNFLPMFDIEIPIIYRFGVLLTIILLVMTISRSQLKKWKNYINFSPIEFSDQMKEEILKEALKTQRSNTFVLLFLLSIFIGMSTIFILTFGSISMVLTMVVGYVLALLLPTLKIKDRKEFISRF